MAYALPVLLVGAVIVAVCYAGVLRYYDAAMHSKFYFDETRSVRAFKFLAGHTRIVDGRRVSAAFVVRSMCDALAIGSSAWKVSKAFAKRNQLEWTEAGCAQPIYELLNVCKSAGLLAHTAQIDDNAAVEGYKFTKFGTKVVPFCEDAAPPTLVAEQSN